MKIFETERLIVKNLEIKDKEFFIELLSDPEIIDPIPQPKFSENEILNKFSDSLNSNGVYEQPKCAYGIFEKEKPDMIGLCLFLTNSENEKELGYRFRKKYWGKGYGTEVTKGMIDYFFTELNVEKVTADVNMDNIGSVKILEKFMKCAREFYNENDKCMDRKYEITKKNWLQQRF